MGEQFPRGYIMGPDDLYIQLLDDEDKPIDPHSIHYSLYDVSSGQDVIIGSAERQPIKKEMGLYYAKFQIPQDANLGLYRIRWHFQKKAGGPTHTVMEEFEVAEAEKFKEDIYGPEVSDMIGRLRKMVRDNSPDRNYHWHPPTSSGTVNEFNEAFGHVWEDDELVEYMERAVDTVNLHPPATHFRSIEDMINAKPSWRQMILMGAASYAAMALQFNWTVEEFSVAGEEEVTVVCPDGDRIEVTIEELYEIWSEVEDSQLEIKF